VRQRGHIAPDARRRGTAPRLFARAGIMAPGSRRVIVRARYLGSRPATWAAPLPGRRVRARATLSLRAPRGPRSRAAVPASRPFGVRSLPPVSAITAMQEK
jgi:hypothetical protein